MATKSYSAVVKSHPGVEQLVQDPVPSSSDIVEAGSEDLQDDTSTSNPSPTKFQAANHLEIKPMPWKKPSFFGGFTYKQSQVSMYPCSTGKASYWGAISRHHANVFPVHQLRLQLPRWISQRVFDLQTYRANVGWQICLKPWIKRHSYSKTFNDVRYGKLSDVEKALAVGDASLFDRDENGGTMLHVSHPSPPRGELRKV